MCVLMGINMCTFHKNLFIWYLCVCVCVYVKINQAPLCQAFIVFHIMAVFTSEHVINQLNANWFLIPSLYVMKYVTIGKTSCGYWKL